MRQIEKEGGGPGFSRPLTTASGSTQRTTQNVGEPQVAAVPNPGCRIFFSRGGRLQQSFEPRRKANPLDFSGFITGPPSRPLGDHGRRHEFDPSPVSNGKVDFGHSVRVNGKKRRRNGFTSSRDSYRRTHAARLPIRQFVHVRSTSNPSI